MVNITAALANRNVIIWTHLSVLQVDFVAKHHKGKVLRVSRAGLNQELVPPAV